MNRFRFALRALAIVALAHPLLAQPRSGGLNDALRWRSIGPFRGGRVTAVAGIAAQPLTYYMGATGGGVWKTDDAGVTWRNVSDAFFKTGSVGAVSVAESNADVVYVGMGEGVPARKPVVGRRGLQVDRRGQDVEARRAPRQQPDRAHPHPPHQR